MKRYHNKIISHISILFTFYFLMICFGERPQKSKLINEVDDKTIGVSVDSKKLSKDLESAFNDKDSQYFKEFFESLKKLDVESSIKASFNISEVTGFRWEDIDISNPPEYEKYILNTTPTQKKTIVYNIYKGFEVYSRSKLFMRDNIIVRGYDLYNCNLNDSIKDFEANILLYKLDSIALKSFCLK